ncbi:MAG: RIP metalloprotease RseP [Myxococcota bacterium]
MWQSSRVGVPDPASPAYRAGLRTGDGVVSVDGEPVTTWDQVRRQVDDGKSHHIEVVRLAEGDQQVEHVEVDLAPEPGWQSNLLPSLSVQGLEPIDVYAGKIAPDSAAEAAGVQAGDRITAIDGTPVLAWDQVIGLVARTATLGVGDEPEVRPLDLELVRDGQRITLTFTPTWEREVVGTHAIHRPLMGIQRYGEAMVDGAAVRKYYGPVEAVGRAHEQVVGLLSMMGDVLGNILKNNLGLTEGIGGPVAIFRVAGESAEAGLFPFVRLMGMISLSLGLVNLLPIPVLDGGQIVFYSFEAVRGRPLPLVWRERIQMVGVLFLAAVFLAVMVKDVSDWLTIPG